MSKIFERIFGFICRLDKWLIFLSSLLGAAGVVLLYSIVRNGASTIDVTPRLYKMQLAALIAGVAAAIVISAIDYHKIVKLWVIFVPASVILVALTFTDMGVLVESTGDRAWLRIGSITVQPSEFLKIAFICTFSLHLSKVGDNINKFGNVVLLLLHAAVPILMIIVQGDDGTALVFACICACMLFYAGISWKVILAALISAPIAGYFVWTEFMKPYQKMRFLVLFDEDLDPLGYGYHQRCGKIALGSGKIFGKGLISDDFTAIPEAQNDFIFAYLGQAFGFIGCAAVTVGLMLVILKIFHSSRTAKDDLGKNICVGMFSLLLTHCILNIGMVLGVMPVIGVPLPMLSQGGSALLAFYIGIGLVMSTHSHSEKNYRVFYDAE